MILCFYDSMFLWFFKRESYTLCWMKWDNHSQSSTLCETSLKIICSKVSDARKTNFIPGVLTSSCVRRYAHTCTDTDTHKMFTPSAPTESTLGGVWPWGKQRDAHTLLATQMAQTLALSAGQFSVLVRQGASLLPGLPVLIAIICTRTRLHTQVYFTLAVGHIFILHFYLRSCRLPTVPSCWKTPQFR